MIDLRHPLAVLSKRLPWASIEASVAPKLAHQAKPAKWVIGEDLAGAFDGELGGGTNIAAPTVGQSAGVVTCCAGMNSAGPTTYEKAFLLWNVLCRHFRTLHSIFNSRFHFGRFWAVFTLRFRMIISKQMLDFVRESKEIVFLSGIDIDTAFSTASTTFTSTRRLSCDVSR